MIYNEGMTVEEFLEGLKELPRRMILDDSPKLIAGAVDAALAEKRFTARLLASTDRTKIPRVCDIVVGYIKGATDRDARHRRAINRVRSEQDCIPPAAPAPSSVE